MTGQKQRKFFRSTTSPGGASTNSMGSPGSSTGGGGGGGEPEIRRTTSAIARFTRSVSKLGSRRRRGGSELPAAILDEENELETRKTLNNKLSYETPIRRAETVPIRGATGYHNLNTSGAATVDVAAFLRAVPDLLGVDASLSNVGAAVRSAENLARTLRASAADVDTTAAATSSSLRTTTGALGAATAARTGEAPAPGIEADTFTYIEATRQWERVYDSFEAALAEHRFEDAFSYWQELHTLTTTSSTSNGTNTNTAIAGSERAWILEIKCSECAAVLVSSLQYEVSSLIKLGSGDGVKLQKVIVLLCQLVGLAAAVATLLDAFTVRLRDQLESLPLGYQRAAAAGSGAAAEEATIDLAAALGQALAMGIAQIADLLKSISSSITSNSDSAVVYGALCDWVVAEVAFGCEVLRKSVLLPRAAPAGLGTTTRCTAAFLVHCDALDTAVNIPTGKVSREAVWSAVEPVLQRRARQLNEGIRKAAATEAKAASNTTAKLPNIRDGSATTSWEELIAVFPSAKRLVTEISGMAAAVAPIAGPSAVASLRTIVTAGFMAFSEAVAAALSASSGQKSSSIVAEIAMEIATRLAEHALAESTSVISSRGWGPAVDAAAMVAALEGMAKTLGMDTV